MIERITCIECPLGCTVEVTLEGGKAVCVRGYGCNRGKAYAESEVTCPVRVVTSTVRTKDGSMVPVKTSKPVRKAAVFEVMKKINAVHPAGPLAVGDVLVRGIDGDADLIMTGRAAK